MCKTRKNYRVGTDLVCECESVKSLPLAADTYDFLHYSLSKIDIGEQDGALLGKPAGRYVSVFFGFVCELLEEARKDISKAVAEELVDLAERAVGKSIDKIRAVVAGLGNPAVGYDSFGSRVCELTPPSSRLSVFGVGVPSKSGLASSELLRCVTKCAGADLVFVFDSLVAKSEARVGRVIQISESGVMPGSGVGCCLDRIDRKALGVPVISVGLTTALALEGEIGELGYLAVSSDAEAIADAGALLLSESITDIFGTRTPDLER